MKTSELTGAALDWAVAKGMEQKVTIFPGAILWTGTGYGTQFNEDVVYSPSSDWNQAGPIIEQNQIATAPYYILGKLAGWTACTSSTLAYDEQGRFIQGSDHATVGPSLVVAAMRTLVHLKLGENVELPKELR